MFWIVLILVVLFIGYIRDAGRSSGFSQDKKSNGGTHTAPRPKTPTDVRHRLPLKKKLSEPFQDKVNDGEITKLSGVQLSNQVRKLESSTEAFIPPITNAELQTKQTLTEITREDEIKAFVEEKSIPFLTHFTDFRNLPGIMSQGLVPRAALEVRGFNFIYNDKIRLDGVKSSVSTSIAFPNYKMFYRYRCESPTRNWVVLIIDKSVLWENKCIFFKHNAADKRMIVEDKDRLARASALCELYGDKVGDIQRDKNLLKPCDPTDPQAEILVLSTIPPNKIRTVVFDSVGAKEYFSRRYPLQKAVCDTGFFSSRDYARRKRVI